MSPYWNRTLMAIIAAAVVMGLFTGCAATRTSIAKRDLDVQTKMSEAIFLEPVAPAQRTVFVQVRNTSDRPSFDIGPFVKSAILAKGYQVTENPEIAHYKLQAQVLSVSKSSPSAAEAALHDGFGATVMGAGTGAISGAVIGGIAGGRQGAAIGAGVGGLLGGVISTIADSSVKDVTYVAVTDVLISEKTKQGVVGRRNLQIDHNQGQGGNVRQTFAEATDEKRHRTRVVSTANKVNLEYEEAATQLAQGLTRSLAGLF